MASQAPRRISLIERESSISNVIYVSDVRSDTPNDATISLDDYATYDTLKNRIVQVKNIQK